MDFYRTVRHAATIALMALLVSVTMAVGRPGQPVSAGSQQQVGAVFVIVMENHNWRQIFGHVKEAPYINSLVAGPGDANTSFMSNYYNPPRNHPSLPNYLWLEAGQCFTYCGTDNNPSHAPHGIPGTHFVTLLDGAGISWKAYEEHDPGGCPLADAGPYAVRHDPFVYFNDVNGDTSYCETHVVRYETLAGDLRNNTVAGYNFITPNLCDDMHDSCKPLNNPITQGDAWLAQNAPPIINWVMAHNGVLFITWDEAAHGDGPIGMIVVSPFAKGHGYDLTQPDRHYAYTHSSTLKTLEEIFGVGPLLGGAGDPHTRDLGALFSVFP